MAPTTPKLTLAFDLYGTLLSTASISDELTAHFGPAQADLIAAKWRQYQLEYTWRLTAMAAGPYHVPFDKITRASLLHAVNEAGLHLADAKADSLMHAYNGLVCFPDVLPALTTLQQARSRSSCSSEEEGGGVVQAVDAVIFSNGTADMVRNSVVTSSTLKQFHSGGSGGGSGLFKKLISVDAVGKYKPTRDVYEYLQREAAGDDWKAQAAVWLISANPFDVVGARAAGLRAAWVDRAGTGWVDKLGDVMSEFGDKRQDLRPTIVARGVHEAVEKILEVGI